MNTEEASLENILKVILAAAFGAWAWVVKTAATAHLEWQKRHEDKIDRLSQRVSKLEGRVRSHEPEDD